MRHLLRGNLRVVLGGILGGILRDGCALEMNTREMNSGVRVGGVLEKGMFRVIGATKRDILVNLVGYDFNKRPLLEASRRPT